ncbi:hypothetical protein PoB_006017400 [Plakobranchus ocellatus]|uniref:Uncharacterized protein n=1 Tax=Plakobranchus ocellatus TaxID=259542 RepID=A0AAV4CP95_9GAST|nr:hypothetical protein PoB_006017400 [Plakobranchus ocellatus]
MKKKGEGRQYLITHNVTDRCRANVVASLVTQGIRHAYSWVKHSNCDTQFFTSAAKSQQRHLQKCGSNREPTLEAAVHVSNNTYLKIQIGCDSHLVEAWELSFVFYSLVLRQ